MVSNCSVSLRDLSDEAEALKPAMPGALRRATSVPFKNATNPSS